MPINLQITPGMRQGKQRDRWEAHSGRVASRPGGSAGAVSVTKVEPLPPSTRRPNGPSPLSLVFVPN